MVVSGWAAREAEVEARGTMVQLRAIPLVPAARASARWCSCRDVTELRRRERELIGQGRHHPGDPPPGEEQPADGGRAAAAAGPAAADGREAREALEEAVRRVGSIAIVHETLSQTARTSRSTSTRSPTGCWRWRARWRPRRRRSCRPPRGRVRRAARRRSRRRWRWCSPSCCRTPSSTAWPAGPARCGCRWPRAGRTGWSSPSPTTARAARGLRPGPSGRLGLQIVRTLVEGELGGTARPGAGRAAAPRSPGRRPPAT